MDDSERREGLGGDEDGPQGDEAERLRRLFGEELTAAGEEVEDEDDSDEDGTEIAEDDEEGQAALAAAALEAIGGPLPAKPYALVVEGTVEEGELVLHRDYETENNHVMLFETLDDAFALSAQFEESTGRKAEPKACDPRLLEERFHIRLFRPGGIIIDIPREVYLELADLED
jgi:hypothetical protein